MYPVCREVACFEQREAREPPVILDLKVYGLILQLDFFRTESDFFASGFI